MLSKTAFQDILYQLFHERIETAAVVKDGNCSWMLEDVRIEFCAQSQVISVTSGVLFDIDGFNFIEREKISRHLLGKSADGKVMFVGAPLVRAKFLIGTSGALTRRLMETVDEAAGLRWKQQVWLPNEYHHFVKDQRGVWTQPPIEQYLLLIEPQSNGY